MGIYYDNKRSEGLDFKEGDKVFLSTKHLRTKRTSKKLDYKRIGLFRVTKKIRKVNYELDLPKLMRLRTNVFYVLLLELVPKDTKLSTDVEVEDEEEGE